MDREKGKKKATESYRVYLSPEVVEAIRETADNIGVSHTKLAAVWLAETVAKKRAELGFIKSMEQNMTEQLAAALGEMEQDAKNEEAA